MPRNTVTKCRICGCTAAKPCLNNDDVSCRAFKPIIQNECLFCSKPELKSTSNKPRIINKPEINMLNIRRVTMAKSYQVRIWIRNISGKGGKGESKAFADSKYGSRKAALDAAIAWRDEMREAAGLSPVYKDEPTSQIQAEVSIDLRSINPSLPEESRFHLITNRQAIIQALSERHKEEQLKEAERERKSQRVKPNHDGTSRHLAEQQAWFEIVRDNGLHMSPTRNGGRRYHKKGR